MCGIFGYVGLKPCQNLIFKGLKTLEYRGYDSAGIASLSKNNKISLVKRKGKLSSLEKALQTSSNEDSIGIGHTRWATHGLPNDINAHPHITEEIALIHNGIVENFLEIKKELEKENFDFISETDSEVVLKLIQHNFNQTNCLEESLLKTISVLKGSFALGVFSPKKPDSLYLAKKKSPVIIGKGNSENLFASDILALTPHTEEFVFLKDNQVAHLTNNSIEIKNFDGESVDFKLKKLDNLQYSNYSKDHYKHFMLKEIHEQAELINRHVDTFYNEETSTLRDNVLGLKELDLSQFNQIIFTGCGSAYYSALVGQYMLEEYIEQPISVHLASEFRYRHSVIGPKTLVIALSQSGETADTLASAEHAKERGCSIIAICNTPYSSLTRVANHTLFMQAGVEIGVAATKTFTTTLLTLAALRNCFSTRKNSYKKLNSVENFSDLKEMNSLMVQILEQKESYKTIAEKYTSCNNFFFIGRGPSYPIALEGSLKLKEISYIHAEGYAGGELKHGPISLITEDLPTIAVCPDDDYSEKMFSNIEEIMARKGRMIAVASPENQKIKGLCHDVLSCPQVKSPALQAILSNTVLQLFAYYLADTLGRDIDQPRNLAKSVTVE